MSATEIISGYANVNPENIMLPAAETVGDVIVFHRGETDDEAPEPKERRQRRRGVKKTQSATERLSDIAAEIRARNEMVTFWIKEYTNGEVKLDKLVEKLQGISRVLKSLETTQSQLYHSS